MGSSELLGVTSVSQLNALELTRWKRGGHLACCMRAKARVGGAVSAAPAPIVCDQSCPFGRDPAWELRFRFHPTHESRVDAFCGLSLTAGPVCRKCWRVGGRQGGSARVVQRHVGRRERHAPHLVPHFKGPARDCAEAVPVEHVRRKREHQVVPVGVVGRRREETLVPAAVAEGVPAGVLRDGRRHERELDDGRDPVSHEEVEHSVDVVPVVRPARRLDRHVVVENPVHPHPAQPELRNAPLQVRLPVRARPQECVAAAERTLPVLRERHRGAG
eukprot:scaffold32_cov120-Isochrysis_galbana.AAC.2